MLERVVLKAGGAGRPPKEQRASHKLAIVIDDVAGKPDPFKNYMDLGIPLTFAIMPSRTQGPRFARLFSENKGRCEYILHLPLEPHRDWPDKAHWLIRVSMTPEQKAALFEKYFAEVPGADGVNNHMGSAFTEDKESMRIILERIKTHRVFFLDSRTSLKTVGYSTAKGMGIPTALNRTFLDNEDSVESIGHELEILRHIAERRNTTAAIGHFHRKHLAEALAKAIPEFKKDGIQFVTLKEVMEPSRP